MYSVEIVETMKRRAEMGRVFYDDKKIELATRSNTSGRRFDADEINVVFWHELVHAILHDMHDPLCYDERFVTQFANRLSQAIRTAKFE
jgi:predicted SprT family Zn-dependent metalloprotease